MSVDDTGRFVSLLVLRRDAYQRTTTPHRLGIIPRFVLRHAHLGQRCRDVFQRRAHASRAMLGSGHNTRLRFGYCADSVSLETIVHEILQDLLRFQIVVK
jgi:hypothetical protein